MRSCFALSIMHIFEGFRKNTNHIFTAWLVFNRQINEIITPIFNIDLIDLLFENINDKKNYTNHFQRIKLGFGILYLYFSHFATYNIYNILHV